MESTRWRPLLALLGALLVLVTAAAAAVLVLLPRVERDLAARLVREAGARGVTLSIDELRLRLPPTVVFRGVSFRLHRHEHQERAIGGRVSEVRVELALRGRGLLDRVRRVSLGEAVLETTGELGIRTAPTGWDVRRLTWGGFEVERTGRKERLALAWQGGEGVSLSVAGLEAGSFVSVLRRGVPVGNLGRLDGIVRVGAAPDGELTVSAQLWGRGVRLAALLDDPEEGSSGQGAPTDVVLSFDASLREAWGWHEVPCFRVTSGEIAASGSLRLSRAPHDAWLDASLDVERVDLASLLAASGLDAPLGAAELGSAAFSGRVTGQLSDPGSLAVAERLEFEPPRHPIPALEQLRGPFLHTVKREDGSEEVIPVVPGAPGYVALDDVPPLFRTALLLSEDAGFYSHKGLDLHEIPVAFATNFARGTTARGASTITQQLAKNLFLSREKRLGRKLREAALALLLESTLDKRRILEIYLNVIEWGPGLHGVGPAARAYFDREPCDLTPAQTAFLVALIPGPVKYQRSFASGTPGPGFRSLVAGVLAKLRSVDAISEESYQEALAEEIRVRSTGRGGAETKRGTVPYDPAIRKETPR